LRRVIVIGIVVVLAVVVALPAVALISNRTAPPTARDGRQFDSSSYDFAAQAEYFPTSKDECKKDGWKDFKDAEGEQLFKNQGDCVSYVATGGKNPPSGAE
jgi:hypothetical protein